MGSEQQFCQLVNNFNDLQKQVYGLKQIYKTPLQGFSFTVNPPTHKLCGIRGYFVLDNQGNEVIISFRLLSDSTVIIDSNINMTGLTLYLF